MYKSHLDPIQTKELIRACLDRWIKEHENGYGDSSSPKRLASYLGLNEGFFGDQDSKIKSAEAGSGRVYFRGRTLPTLFTFATAQSDASKIFEWQNGDSDLQSLSQRKSIEPGVTPFSHRTPEFPRHRGKYPATPTKDIEYDKFGGLSVKDESQNPHSGTHKDRMAHEIRNWYETLVYQHRMGDSRGAPPQLSLLSAGAAATAIQREMKGLDSTFQLRVLVDSSTSPNVISSLEEDGCLVYTHDLSEEELNSNQIRKLTYNAEGIDITFATSNELKQVYLNYYDWLADEILSQNPDVCIVPVGSGDLFFSILRHARTLLDRAMNPENPAHPFVNIQKLTQMRFIGAVSWKHSNKHHFPKLFHPHPVMLRANLDRMKTVFRSIELPEADPAFTRQAMKLATQNLILTEPSAISGLNVFLQKEEDLSRYGSVLVVNTGRNRLREEVGMTKFQRLQTMISSIHEYHSAELK